MKFTTQLHLFFIFVPSNSSSNMMFLLPSGGQSSCLNFRHVQVIKNCHDDKWVTISRKFHSLIIEWRRESQCSSRPYYTASEKKIYTRMIFELTGGNEVQKKDWLRWIRKLDLVYFTHFSYHTLQKLMQGSQIRY